MRFLVRAVSAIGLLSVLFAATSCSSTPPAIIAPTQDTAWATQSLGGQSDLAVMIRPTAAREDTYWGPLANRLLSETKSSHDATTRWARGVSSAKEIDVYLTLRDPLLLAGGSHKHGQVGAGAIGWIAVVYGMPERDPRSFTDDDGKPLFLPPSNLSSGVTMWPADPEFASESGGLVPTVFTTRDNVWIAADQVSAPRVSDMLARSSSPPPPLASAPDALAGVAFSVTSMRFVSAGSSDPGNVAAGAVAAGIGLRGGANGALEAFADYGSDADAERAYKSLQESCAQHTKECVFPPSFFREVRAERGDKRIRVTMLFSEALLRSIQSYSR
jgi:hypothetical protein